MSYCMSSNVRECQTINSFVSSVMELDHTPAKPTLHSPWSLFATPKSLCSCSPSDTIILARSSPLRPQVRASIRHELPRAVDSSHQGPNRNSQLPPPASPYNNESNNIATHHRHSDFKIAVTSLSSPPQLSQRVWKPYDQRKATGLRLGP